MEPGTISKERQSPPLDFKKLRDDGIAFIQALAGNEWTDFNTHDPGVTILEALCYSLTDLAYRTELYHESFSEKWSPEHLSHDFFKPEELKQNLPYTKLDFEKFIEQSHPNVLYAWLEEEPIFNGGNIVLGGYEITLMFQYDHKFGNLNTDAIRLPFLDDNELDIILFDESSERINWKHYKKVVASRWDVNVQDNFFVFETYNCQIPLVLDVIYQNRTQADQLPVKARVSLSRINRNTRRKFDLQSYKDIIIKSLESEEFLEAVEQSLNKEARKNELITEVRLNLLSCRNLCEDFVSIKVAAEQELKLDAEIILNDYAPPAFRILERIFKAIDAFLLKLVFDTRNQTNKRKTVLYGSNIVEEIMRLDGIEGVRILDMNLYVDGVPTIALKEKSSFECIQLLQFSEFAPKLSRNKSTIIFTRADTKEEPEQPGEDEKEASESASVHTEKNETPAGNTDHQRVNAELFDDLFNYHSLQDDFPQNYRLREGPSKSKLIEQSDIRRRQFKAYLLFFERIMIDYLQKLKGFRELLSVHQNLESKEDELGILKKEVPDIEQFGLINESLWQDQRSSPHDQYAQIHRRHKILNHLLARFASQYTPLPMGNPGVDQMKKMLEDKIRLLKNIPSITRERGVGISLKPQTSIWENEELISGFQKRVYRLLGLHEGAFKHVKLSESKSKEPSGFYIVEHILLVKKDDKNIAHRKFNAATEILHDYIMHMSKEYAVHPPYSFQLTVVIPNWNYEWRNRKRIIENMISAEIPAHILPYFHWLNRKNLSDFETCYEDWLKALIKYHDYSR